MGRRGRSSRSEGIVFDNSSLIVMDVNGVHYPIAIKVGRELYRVCPVCGSVLKSSTVWRRHVQRYHAEWFTLINAGRSWQLMPLIPQQAIVNDKGNGSEGNVKHVEAKPKVEAKPSNPIVSSSSKPTPTNPIVSRVVKLVNVTDNKHNTQ